MYFLLLESVVCALKGWYLKKKATAPPTQTHLVTCVGTSTAFITTINTKAVGIN